MASRAAKISKVSKLSVNTTKSKAYDTEHNTEQDYSWTCNLCHDSAFCEHNLPTEQYYQQQEPLSPVSKQVKVVTIVYPHVNTEQGHLVDW